MEIPDGIDDTKDYCSVRMHTFMLLSMHLNWLSDWLANPVFLPVCVIWYRSTRPLEPDEIDEGPCCSRCGSRWSVLSTVFKDYNISMYPCCKCPVQVLTPHSLTKASHFSISSHPRTYIIASALSHDIICTIITYTVIIAITIAITIRSTYM